MYGFDGGKLVKGRKRHIIVDTHRLLLSVVVTASQRSRSSRSWGRIDGRKF
ncbi:transposase [Moorena sp. SIO4G3]|uniref:transposase n=1 Tax=Moorena sp. SIO4G3 TaxID=2607821 RepID=UPI00344520AD